MFIHFNLWKMSRNFRQAITQPIEPLQCKVEDIEHQNVKRSEQEIYSFKGKPLDLFLFDERECVHVRVCVFFVHIFHMLAFRHSYTAWQGPLELKLFKRRADREEQANSKSLVDWIYYVLTCTLLNDRGMTLTGWNQEWDIFIGRFYGQVASI